MEGFIVTSYVLSGPKIEGRSIPITRFIRWDQVLGVTTRLDTNRADLTEAQDGCIIVTPSGEFAVDESIDDIMAALDRASMGVELDAHPLAGDGS